jgi:hypothetical protein
MRIVKNVRHILVKLIHAGRHLKRALSVRILIAGYVMSIAVLKITLI